LTFDRIHLEKLDGRSAGCRSAKYQHAAPGKMIRPALAARFEQTNELARPRVESRQVGPFELVAPVTSKSKIAKMIPASPTKGKGE